MLLRATLDMGPRGLQKAAGAIQELTSRISGGFVLDTGEIIQFSPGVTDHPGWLGSLVTWGLACQVFQEQYMRKQGHLVPDERFPTLNLMFDKSVKKALSGRKPFIEKYAVWPMPLRMKGPENYIYQWDQGGANVKERNEYLRQTRRNVTRSWPQVEYGTDIAGWIKEWGTTNTPSSRKEWWSFPVTFVKANPIAAVSFGLTEAGAYLKGKEILTYSGEITYTYDQNKQKVWTQGVKDHYDAYMDYMTCSRWLITAAEWWRVISMGGRYQDPPADWFAHCMRWGVGVVRKGRYSNYRIPEGLTVPGGINVRTLLEYVVQFTPAPGTLVNKKGYSIVEEVRPPCYAWPKELLGAMSPSWEAPKDLTLSVQEVTALLAEKTSREIELKIDLTVKAVQTVINIIAGGGGAEDLAKTALELAELGLKTAEAWGAKLGPIISVLGVAKRFSSMDWTSNPAVAFKNISIDIDKFADLGAYGEQQIKKFMAQAATVQDITKNVELINGWTYCKELYGDITDVSQTSAGEAKTRLLNMIK